MISRISALIEFWGITPEDLQRESPELARAPSRPEMKYRHPVTGETWDGQGPHPEWMRRALLKEGYRVDELKPDLQDNAAAALLASSSLIRQLDS